MAELRVLVCDDDSDMLELMLRRLDKMGFKPDRAGDGGVAQALIKENLYDLIVTDIYMPEATGLELLQNRSLPNFYFHITTAYNILRHNGLEIGKRDFMGAS